MSSSQLAVSGVLGGLMLFGAPRTAEAFCGFYVSGADGKLFNDATQVVLMRDGTRTVLSMQNDYKGPPQDFALVVPVPVVLQKENVKTLSPDVFKRIDTLSAPRLVEYWEQDPCPSGIGLGNIGTLGHGAGTGSGQGFGSGHGRLGGEPAVKIEAQFEVGEYEIVILSAKDSSSLDTWLRENKYKIPDNAEPALKPYVQAGSKFFVAKVNVAKVKFVDGRASLSPLRFHYDTDKFELPVKLGLLNSSGTQDIIVNILAADRYEVASYPNVTIPTNLDVTEAARGSFGTFYATLFDRTIEKNPRAVVTEYAWQATNCDPCPGDMQGMSGNDLAALGADVMPNMRATSSRVGGNATLRQGATTVTGGKLPPEVIQRIVRQNFGRFRLCYENGLAKNPALSGRVSLKFVIDAHGAVESVADGGSDLPDSSVVTCMTRATAGISFPEPEDKKKVTVIYPIVLGAPTSPSSSVFNVSTTNMKHGLILSRLHARYGKDTLGNDLVFRVADPIIGGRENWKEGKLETGVSKAPTEGPSSFQGRYAIRHPWPGKIECKEPRRGVWGGRWSEPVDSGAEAGGGLLGTGTGMAASGGGGGGGVTTHATNLAYAQRNASLASFTNINAAELDGTIASTASADAGGAPLGDAGAATPATPSSRCGCRVVGDSGTNRDASTASVFGVLLLGMLASARRYRHRAERNDDDDNDEVLDEST